ncbi:Hydrolase of the alpha/beta superfamily-like protein [Rhizobium leguminosarum bv. trifolii WSM2304]|uniref:Hydrolase of the alpha/beta superfamily-like protein n=1 Tax=Rhizobium leguminosarum bv. trifolii (strain WSM2304) TaxID=395492 RepID=A0ABF7QQ00_RHILW|nr:alpha/beta hydrolase [Rhizobium leguminosarum]ACI56197.1 Hydrolase of the alpha/beta superfamily-like protein [Rhizobium leguminosarum bv. trifolii WSM2304]
MGKISFTNTNNPTITMSAVINFPEGFDEGRKCPVIVVSHPGGGVKEQTAGTYARKLTEGGFVTIAYDASYQGESGGEPRQLENPHVRTEDISAVIDYLTTLPYVDRDRIGAMGICAGAGYTANAAIQDRRIKAVGTVSAVNIGSMFRNGWENTVKDADAEPVLAMGSAARTKDASKWMSDDLLARAASKDKKLHIVEGSNHMDLYDGQKYVDEAVSVLEPFFKTKLTGGHEAQQAAE